MKSKKLKFVIIGSVASLLVLIFLSGSIYNHNLPMVTAAMPRRGHLNHVELTTGIVRHSSMVEVSADISGSVAGVLVQEGEFAVKGQPLVEMDFRGADDEILARIDDINASLREQIDNINLSRQRHLTEIERNALNINNIQRQID